MKDKIWVTGFVLGFLILLMWDFLCTGIRLVRNLFVKVLEKLLVSPIERFISLLSDSDKANRKYRRIYTVIRAILLGAIAYFFYKQTITFNFKAIWVAISYFAIELAPLLFLEIVRFSYKRITQKKFAKKIISIFVATLELALVLVFFVLIPTYVGFGKNVDGASYFLICTLGMLAIINAVLEFYISKEDVIINSRNKGK